MKAFLLATGERNNLHPLTTRYPSPMLPVANRPVLTYPIELMIRHQFDDIVLSLLHQADSIEAYCETGRRWNVDFTYLLQREALGSAGAMKRAQNLLSDTFLVMPGDALVDVDLTELYTFHRQHGGIATAVLATRADGKQDLPFVQLDSSSRIQSVQTNESLPCALNFTNVFMFEPEIFEYVPNQTVFDCQTDLIERLLAEGEVVRGFVMQGYWNPLDSFAGYQAAQQDYLRSLMTTENEEIGQTHLLHPYVEAGDDGAGVWRGLGAMIHPSVQINAPVYIGAGCQLGRNVTIGPDVVLGPNSIVDDGATIESSTVLPDTYIGKLLKVQQKLVSGSTLIDIESETSVEVTDQLLLGNAGTEMANALLYSMLERLIALVILLLAAPVLALPVLLTWFTGSGSVLVRELRIGQSITQARLRGESKPVPIHLYRLRTRMSDGSYTLVGGWLEKSDLHRLPELFNVLLGDLALVGVKPLTEEEARQVAETWQHRRFDCPPGFTGRWYTEVNAESATDDLFVADVYQAAMQSATDSLSQLKKTPVVWWNQCRTRWSREQRNAPVMIQRRIQQ